MYLIKEIIMNKKKVILGMSGGIDSSVSAFLLKEAGYEVIGVTFKVFECEDISEYIDLEGSCCSVEGIQDAGNVARLLDIPHYTINVSEDFNKTVINNFVDEYFNGRTPNPCIVCNREIKWKRLIKIADEMDADFVATGHYAQTRFDESVKRYVLSKGVDNRKDQSYALWRLSQSDLMRTIFPLGKYTKTEIRKIAEENKLPVANKAESFEICFIPDNDYCNYLRKKQPERINKIGEGDIIFEGKVIGKHKGYPFYTIGQRRGLGIALKQPAFVKNIIPDKNIIEIGLKEEVLNYTLSAVELNMIKHADIPIGFPGSAKIRYKDAGSPAVVEEKSEKRVKMKFKEAKTAITPGQSLVFYENDDVVMGGIISKLDENEI
jgi:tRNA-uridine 2-sulfurtransferase